MVQASTHRLTRNGASLFYRRWSSGEGPTLVLLHGLASNSTRWRELAEDLTARRELRVLAPDLRGHGESVWRGRLRTSQWIADIAAMLDHESCEGAVIGGHCLGANVALRFAMERQQLVRGLVLVEPMLPGALAGAPAVVRPLRWLLPLLAWPVRVLNALGIHRRSLPGLDLSELDRQTRKAMAEHGGEDAMLRRYARPTGDLFYMPVATYLQALYQALRDIGSLDRVVAPTLAMLSDGALLADPERSRRLLAAVPDVEIERFDALHWIPTEQPEAMAQSMQRFLGRVAKDSLR